LLTHPSHHIHDQRDHICSFSGNVHDSSPKSSSFFPRAGEGDQIKCECRA
jgi:hypothetical protein